MIKKEREMEGERCRMKPWRLIGEVFIPWVTEAGSMGGPVRPWQVEAGHLELTTLLPWL